MSEAGKLHSDCLKKKRYRTQGFADRVAKDAEGKRKTPLRSYYCSICLGFHLTHKPLTQGASA